MMLISDDEMACPKAELASRKVADVWHSLRGNNNEQTLAHSSTHHCRSCNDERKPPVMTTNRARTNPDTCTAERPEG